MSPGGEGPGRTKEKKKGTRKSVDWELLEDLWPIEDRPRRLKERKAVRGMSMGQVILNDI